MPDFRIIPVAEAMRIKRAELQAQPLDRIWRDLAETAILVFDQERANEKRRTCQHPNKRGSGMIGSDGSSRTEWWCPDCGKSGKHETPPDPKRMQPQSIY